MKTLARTLASHPSFISLASLASLIPLVAAMAPSLGCTAPIAEEARATGTTSEALICATCVRQPRPIGPLLPLDEVVVLDSDTLFNKLDLALAGSKLSIDTTNSAPEAFGPIQTIPNPVYRSCQDEMNDCTELPVSQRKQCYADVNDHCANVPHTITTQILEHSYFTYGPGAKDAGVQNVFFPLETMHYNGALFSFDIDINQVHTFLGTAGSLFGGYGSGPTGEPSAWIDFGKIQSNSPTVLISADYIPNVDLTNMAATAVLVGITPTPDQKGLDYTSVTGSFHFDLNFVNIPDGWVNTFYDVSALIRSRVEERIRKVFDNDPAHHAISAILTGLFNEQVALVHKDQSVTIKQVVLAGDALQVHYVVN